MAIIHGEGIDRTDIDTAFQHISFTHADAEALAAKTPVLRILPQLNVIKVGGQSIMDRGRAAVQPVLTEIIANKDEHQILVGVGGGTRARHAYSVALDLGLPTSVLAKLGMGVPMQNARMLQLILAKDGGVLIDHDDFGKLPLYYRLGCVPILPGMPPFEHWEKPAKTGRIPTHRTDAGVYLTAEVLGARSCIFVKDEKGLFTANPKVDRKATFIDRIHAGELEERQLPDLIIEPIVLTYLQRAQAVKEIQIIDGRVPGNLTRALNGEHVGTIIYA
jgi:molybdenum storage protein